MATDPAKRLSECVQAAQQVSDEQYESEKQGGAVLLWLEKQLSNIVEQLLAMIADIESGLSLRDIGFFSYQEFEEMVEDIESQIASLKSKIRSLKEVGRN